ncbi:MAG: hypothetical protein R3C03_20040 [Pirellulaceae bacterium]
MSNVANTTVCFRIGDPRLIERRQEKRLAFLLFLLPILVLNGCKPVANPETVFFGNTSQACVFGISPFFVEYCFVWDPKREGASSFGSFRQFVFSHDDAFWILTSGTPDISRSFGEWQGFFRIDDLKNVNEKFGPFKQQFTIKNTDYFATINSDAGETTLKYVEPQNSRLGREMLFWGFCARDWTPYWDLSLEEWAITSVQDEIGKQIQFSFVRKDGQGQEEVVFSEELGRCISRRTIYPLNGEQEVMEHQFKYVDDSTVIPMRIDIKMDGQEIGFLETRNFSKINKVVPTAFRLSAYGLNEPPFVNRKFRQVYWLIPACVLGMIGLATFWRRFKK